MSSKNKVYEIEGNVCMLRKNLQFRVCVFGSICTYIQLSVYLLFHIRQSIADVGISMNSHVYSSNVKETH